MKQLIQTPTLLAMICLHCLVAHAASAQEGTSSRFIYSAKITFQSYGLPFKNFGSSFKNVGGAIGIDCAYNKSQSLLQSFSLGFQHHREHEQFFYIHTQLAYRPLLFNVLEPGIAIGIGRALAISNPANPYYALENGSWNKSSHQRQGHWLLPVSLSMGYRIRQANGRVFTPYISYEAAAFIQYNSAFPLLPYSQLSTGTRIRF
ncbi:hypothetical protein [Cesiribacter sp. SM1]|uniref:hypothetical protein n=1 Tax=Cesiribacter sp. SM1 TaxID=2861196 RepID=UPI001CD49D47|nr:hypothetical protein [Cesiribacter sp. SM1]